MAKRVRQYTLDCKLVKEYKSIAELTRSFRLDKDNLRLIRQSCERGLRGTSLFGYIWRYADDDEMAGVDFNSSEQWRELASVQNSPCKGYYISSYGRIIQVGSGDVRYKTVPQFMKGGTPTVEIVDMNQREHQVPVCLLVAREFVTNPEGFYKVRHKDKNNLNNRADNLVWF